MKKCLSLLLALSLAVLPLTACGSASAASNGEVVVYNWGEYIDPETISMFEEETGIKVIYDEFETNEIMYPKIEAGASKYDVVCPSDYMIQKMIENDLLAELNYDNIPNAKKKYRRTVLGTVKAVRSGEQIFRTLLLGNRWNSVQ